MNKIIKIIKLGRFQFVIAGFFLYTVGALFATLNTSYFDLEKFFLGYAILFPAHLAVSYSNDYFDWEADKKSQKTFFSGGSGVLVENPDLRTFSKLFAVFLTIISITMALVFAVKYGNTGIIILAILGNFLVWSYSAPPIKLSYRGLGEIPMVLTGFLLPGLGYLALTGYIDLNILLFTIPLMIFELIFICCVEMPDLESDQKGGKNTLIVRKGREFGFKIIGVSSISGTIILFMLSFLDIYPQTINFRIISVISLILLIPCINGLFKTPKARKESLELSENILISLIIFVIIVAVYFALISFKMISI